MGRDGSPRENWDVFSRRKEETLGMQKSTDTHDALSDGMLFI